MAKKEITGTVKLQILPGVANPSPPVGTALGPKGINIAGFCKEFNEKTSKIVDKDLPVQVLITIYKDRSFSFEVNSPPMSKLLLKAIGKKSGSSKPHSDKIGTLTVEQLKEVVLKKMQDLSAYDVQKGMKIAAGTARSMGIEIEGDINHVES